MHLRYNRAPGHTVGELCLNARYILALKRINIPQPNNGCVSGANQRGILLTNLGLNLLIADAIDDQHKEFNIPRWCAGDDSHFPSPLPPQHHVKAATTYKRRDKHDGKFLLSHPLDEDSHLSHNRALLKHV